MTSGLSPIGNALEQAPFPARAYLTDLQSILRLRRENPTRAGDFEVALQYH